MRLLLIGYSKIAQKRVLPALAEAGITGADVASRTRAAEVALPEGIAGRVYGDYEAALDESDADLVYVSTVNSAHAEWAQKALGHGFHVVVDKPACTSLGDTERLLDLAQRPMAPDHFSNDGEPDPAAPLKVEGLLIKHQRRVVLSLIPSLISLNLLGRVLRFDPQHPLGRTGFVVEYRLRAPVPPDPAILHVAPGDYQGAVDITPAGGLPRAVGVGHQENRRRPAEALIKGESLVELQWVDLSKRTNQGSPVVSAIQLEDTDLVESRREFLAQLNTMDERRVYEQAGQPERLDRVQFPSHEEVTWWYFRHGRAYRFRDGTLQQVIPFDPVEPL